MNLTLIDVETGMVAAWQEHFAPFPEVRILQGDILRHGENTVVSPANSHGVMDGGIDQDYTDFFGPRPQEEILRAIDRRPDRLLPVGQAILVSTGHGRIPYMIAAPTMELPGPVPAAHAYFAMRALLQCARDHAHCVERLYCPGLTTGVGGVDFGDAAREMALAYGRWRAGLVR